MSLKNNARLFRVFGNLTNKPGSAPGTFNNIDNQKKGEVDITLLDYDGDHAHSVTIESIEECTSYLNAPTKTWIKIKGLGDLEKLKSIWTYFDLHPLIREDIINTVQRPKVERYRNCVYIVMRMLWYSEEKETVQSNQVSIILGENFVISFQETHKPIFEPVIDRINISRGRIRDAGNDYLVYALLDNITDHYFNLLNELNEQLENVEDNLMEEPDESTFQAIHTLRKNITFTRKSIWPARDMFTLLTREDMDFIESATKIYLRDVQDHIGQIMDNIDNFRDMSMGMYDMYMSDASNKMNEVMKLLTIIATIFIPLTFIAGVYGMNFNPEKSPFNMPELNWYLGYPLCLLVMAIVAIVMIIYFYRKGWI